MDIWTLLSAKGSWANFSFCTLAKRINSVFNVIVGHYCYHSENKKRKCVFYSIHCFYSLHSLQFYGLAFVSLFWGNGSLNRNAHFFLFFLNVVHRDINQSVARAKSQTSFWLKLDGHAGFIRIPVEWESRSQSWNIRTRKKTKHIMDKLKD